jgi:hypothetical protein
LNEHESEVLGLADEGVMQRAFAGQFGVAM